MQRSLRRHWPEYMMEAACLGLYMMSACFFAALLQHPGSPVTQAIPNPHVRRALIGLAMGLTGIFLAYSPWGKQSGAHFNPALTLTYLRLGKVAPRDAAFYITSQFLGGILGVQIAGLLFRSVVSHPNVHYALTLPGIWGATGAFLGEIAITFVLMSVILRVSNTPKLAHFTPLFAGSLVALYITLEGPVSGMSMNPARTFGSALAAREWSTLWVYFTAPLLGMLLAAQVYLQQKGVVFCAKMHHQNAKRCIFCEYRAEKEQAEKIQNGGNSVSGTGLIADEGASSRRA